MQRLVEKYANILSQSMLTLYTQGRKKTTLHFSIACILQSVWSKTLNFFESHLIVVNLKILWLKILRCCFNQSCSVISETGCFWSVFDAKLSRKLGVKGWKGEIANNVGIGVKTSWDEAQTTVSKFITYGFTLGHSKLGAPAVPIWAG